ncbi:MAG TPA: ABC transporter permease [Thermomicrobiales bacterium]|nr:ABC transporter permease [Thermomicrobiales bacterium]
MTAAERRTATTKTEIERLSSRSNSLWRDAIRRLRRNPGAIAGLVILILLAAMGVFAPLLAPAEPNVMVARDALHPPGGAYLFGTDQFGRDILSRIMHGARLSFQVGFIAVGIASVFGVTLGLLSGYYGRWVDSVIGIGIDIMLAFPGILLALAIVAILGPSLLNLMIAVGIAAIPTYTRLVRGAVLATRELQYIEAARVIGATDRSIMTRHILPNVLAPVIVLATLGIGGAILVGAALSFLGLGASPPTPEWGAMLSSGRNFLQQAWWITFFPGLAIMLTVLSINLLGDGLRDALDPRLRR